MASHAFAARNCEISPLEIAGRALQNLPGVMLQVMAETCPKCQVQKWAEPTPRRWRHDEFTGAGNPMSTFGYTVDIFCIHSWQWPPESGHQASRHAHAHGFQIDAHFRIYLELALAPSIHRENISKMTGSKRSRAYGGCRKTQSC